MRPEIVAPFPCGHFENFFLIQDRVCEGQGEAIEVLEKPQGRLPPDRNGVAVKIDLNWVAAKKYHQMPLFTVLSIKARNCSLREPEHRTVELTY